MPTAPKQRKMAVVGSRSVGKALSSLSVRHLLRALTTITLPRQILLDSAVCGQPFRRQLLPDY